MAAHLYRRWLLSAAAVIGFVGAVVALSLSLRKPDDPGQVLDQPRRVELPERPLPQPTAASKPESLIGLDDQPSSVIATSAPSFASVVVSLDANAMEVFVPPTISLEFSFAGAASYSTIKYSSAAMSGFDLESIFADYRAAQLMSDLLGPSVRDGLGTRTLYPIELGSLLWADSLTNAATVTWAAGHGATGLGTLSAFPASAPAMASSSPGATAADSPNWALVLSVVSMIASSAAIGGQMSGLVFNLRKDRRDAEAIRIALEKERRDEELHVITRDKLLLEVQKLKRDAPPVVTPKDVDTG